MKRQLIKNGHIISPADDLDIFGDILIEDGLIKLISEGSIDPIPEDTEITDATGVFVAPGFVDVHAHFRDPGQTDKEDIHSGAKAAIAGGYTTVVLMANTLPPVDCTEILSQVKEKASKEGIRILQCATVTKGRRGEELTDFKELKAAGAAGFTDDGSPLLNEELVREAMIRASETGSVLSFHEEDPSFVGTWGINNGDVSRELGIKGADRQAEISMVKRDLSLALEIGCRIDIQHVSAAETVEIIREAKKRDSRGLIHAEATPNHFSLTEDAVRKYGALAKINPPLRTEKDRQAILEGLKDGTIDIIATDHAPHLKEDKEGPITRCASGIIGLETAFSLGLKNLIHTGVLSLKELIMKMSVNPADLYGIDAGHIRQGSPAELVLFSTEEMTTYSGFHGKSLNTPFLGETLPGRIIGII